MTISEITRRARRGDEDGFGHTDLDERRFRAFKSSDPAIIKRLATAAENLIDASLAA